MKTTTDNNKPGPREDETKHTESHKRIRALFEEHIGPVNFVAGALDISRQAMLSFLQEGEFPVVRSLQIEKMSNGRIKWQECSPKAAQTIEDTPVIRLQ